MKTLHKPRTFKNPAVLHQMLFLRLSGWPLEELAFKFNCDKSSVWDACIRSGLPKEIMVLPRPLIVFRTLYLNFEGERLNRGKTYAEYLEDQKRIQLKKRMEALGYKA